MSIRTRIGLALALLGAVVFVGAAGFHFIEGGQERRKPKDTRNACALIRTKDSLFCGGKATPTSAVTLFLDLDEATAHNGRS